MNLELRPEMDQVLRGLALNREPGWNFPGNFLQVSFDAVTAEGSVLSLDPGSHCTDADGQLNLAAVCVLADVGMSVAMRRHIGDAARMATVSMALRFTGALRSGRLTLRGRLEGFVDGTAARQGLARAEIHAGDALVCSASSTFVALGNPDGLAPLPLRRRADGVRAVALTAAQLSEDERCVYQRAATASSDPSPSFIERFWGLLPVRTEDGAVCNFPNGLHVGNRVGHTQGGITFGLAALTSNAALGDGWRLVGSSSSYLTPGTGASLHAAARILHRGRLTAVARTEIRDAAGKLVLDAVTNHARLA